MTQGFVERLHEAAGLARRDLVLARHEPGHWTSDLSPSALATVTAVTTLTVGARRPPLVTAGLDWLATVESGDSPESSSIGVYFAKPCYFERPNPPVFTTAALNRAARMFASAESVAPS